MIFWKRHSKTKNGKAKEKPGKQLNTEIDQTFVLSSTENVVKARLAAYFRERRYKTTYPVGGDPALRFERAAPLPGLGIHTDPETVDCVATVRLVMVAADTTEVFCHLHLKSVAGFPWEKWYWAKELRALRRALAGGLALPPSVWDRIGVNLLNIGTLSLSAGLLAVLAAWATFAGIQGITGWSSDTVVWVGLPIIMALIILGGAGLQHLLLERRAFKWRNIAGPARPEATK